MALPPVIAVISSALFFGANVTLAVIHQRIAGIIFCLALHHGRNIGLIIIFSVNQIKIVKDTTTASGAEIFLTDLQCDLIIKAWFFTDIRGRYVLQGWRYLKSILDNGIKSGVRRIGVKNIKITE